MRNDTTIRAELRYAIARNELSLHYQPLLNIATGALAGLEALLRWQHSFLGNVSPLVFIPLAEASGLIGSIDEWVIRTACKQAKKWQLIGICPKRIAVNISKRQLDNAGFPDQVASILKESHLDPSRLELEIPESLLATDTPRRLIALNRLKAIGVKIALDNVGTGCSDFNRLKRLPIDRLKIDRSVIQNMRPDSRAPINANAVIALAQQMKIDISAAGVENGRQIHKLRSFLHMEVQGNYFSHPLTPEKAERFLRYSSSKETPSAAASEKSCCC